MKGRCSKIGLTALREGVDIAEANTSPFCTINGQGCEECNKNGQQTSQEKKRANVQFFILLYLYAVRKNRTGISKV